MKFSIRQAELGDADRIMDYIGREWRQNHVLSQNKPFFLNEFSHYDKLNFFISEDSSCRINGLIGFIRYSNDPKPDIAGSFWHAMRNTSNPYLGIMLLKQLRESYPHRSLITPGINPETTVPIYKLLKIPTGEMRHFFLLNSKLDDFYIAALDRDKYVHKTPVGNADNFTRSTHFRRLCKSDKDAIIKLTNSRRNRLPYKDYDFLRKRYFDYKYQRYTMFGVFTNSEICSMICCRVVNVENRSALRIIDYIGDFNYFPFAIPHLMDIMYEENHEYIDFINYGFDEDIFKLSGFSELDKDIDNIIIPDHFAPFEQRNITLHFMADIPGHMDFQICKADGDQDRPNSIPIDD